MFIQFPEIMKDDTEKDIVTDGKDDNPGKIKNTEDVDVSDVNFFDKDDSSKDDIPAKTPDNKDDDKPEKKVEEEPVYLIEGKDYSESQIKEAIAGISNAADHTKQEALDKDRASIEPLLVLREKLFGDKELVEYLREEYLEKHGSDSGAELDALLGFNAESFKHPLLKERDKLAQTNADLEDLLLLRDEEDEFEIKSGLSRKKVKEVRDFSLDYFKKNNVALSMEDSYKLYAFDSVQKQATSGKRRIVVPKNIGVRGINRDTLGKIPSGDDSVADAVPEEIANDFREALRCFHVKSYRATVTMCRRAIQASCKELKAVKEKLIDQINDLAKTGKITEPLKEMARQIRKIGNDGAHPNDDLLKDVTEQDAAEIIGFVRKYFDHVYVIPKNVEAMKARKTES